jgi:hypothetical protein
VTPDPDRPALAPTPADILAAIAAMGCKRRRELLRLIVGRWCPICGRGNPRGGCTFCKIGVSQED